MQRMMNRILALMLAVVILAAVMVPAVTQEAQALSYNGSSGYESGKFYRALTKVKLTGDQRVDIVNVAKSQVGYQEGGSNNQLSGEVYGGLNFTEYGRWYGVQDMWCAIFASWCAKVAGISTDIIPSHSYTPNGLQWFRDRERAYSPEQVLDGEYTPRAGDLIYFKSSRNTNQTNHVGIVTGYSDGRIYTIEGNVGAAGISTNGGTVAAKSYPITNEFIVYICSPNYSGSSTSVKNVEPKKEDAASERMAALRKAVYAMETGGDADYGRITESYLSGISGRAITIGSGQWYGTEAQGLLLRIHSADKAAFAKLDTAGIGDDLDGQDWNAYQISADSEKAECIRAILKSDAGRRVQDEMMDERLTAYVQEAKEMGVSAHDAQMLCAGLRHVGGANAVAGLLKQVEGELTLDNIYAALNGEGVEFLRFGGTMLYEVIVSE